MDIELIIKKKITILALGAESAGNFSVYKNGKIYFSPNFGDLLEEENWKEYQKAVLKYLKENKISPAIILTDLHPLFRTTHWGKELSKKYKAKHIQIQHHLAHAFSTIGDKILHDALYSLPNTFYCIVCDGTGYGLDGKIWGGELFKISNSPNYLISNKKSNTKHHIRRIGHLENQILIGGDLAIREPARMLISILNKVNSISSSPLGRGCRVFETGEGKTKHHKKNIIYSYVKKYYTKNQFELFYNQLQQNFNCQETSSTGRILDAVSLLLGFCENERKYKHEPIDQLEKNSTIPYTDLKPIIKDHDHPELPITNYQLRTTPLFEYLTKDINEDKKRLAATAQRYITQGLYEIISLFHVHVPSSMFHVFFSGGLANNKIMSSYLESKDAYTNKKIPRGDAGLSFGQIIYYLLIH